MDIDFGRIYRNQNSHEQRLAYRRSDNKPAKPQRKISFYLSIVIVAFTLGLVAGIYWQKLLYSRQQTNALQNPEPAAGEAVQLSANISEHAQKNLTDSIKIEPASPKAAAETPDKLASALESEHVSYLILGKIYPNKNEAYHAGMQLKKIGLPVFLAESGGKMKVYIGPLDNKDKAYETLARVKAISEFSGAILYKK